MSIPIYDKFGCKDIILHVNAGLHCPCYINHIKAGTTGNIYYDLTFHSHCLLTEMPSLVFRKKIRFQKCPDIHTVTFVKSAENAT